MEIINGEVFITHFTQIPSTSHVTNGSVFRGRRDIVALKINAGRNIQFATYLGGSANDIPAFKALRIVNNRMIIAGTTSSSNFPVTIPTFYQGGVSDTYAAVLDAQTGISWHPVSGWQQRRLPARGIVRQQFDIPARLQQVIRHPLQHRRTAE